MEKTTKTHFLRNDSRKLSLDMIIDNLSETVSVLKNQIAEISWYDIGWFKEESEPIYGLAFIAFQNYINSSIKDFPYSKEKKELFYKLEQPFNNSKTKTELIISLANYFKHQDEGNLHRGTKETLKYFKLNHESPIDIDDSPIFHGLTILNKEWDLIKIKEIVFDWRELIWLKHEAG